MNDPQIMLSNLGHQFFTVKLKSMAELRPRHALTFEVIETLGIEVNKALTGEASAQDAMDAANKKIDRLLKSEDILINIFCTWAFYNAQVILYRILNEQRKN